MLKNYFTPEGYKVFMGSLNWTFPALLATGNNDIFPTSGAIRKNLGQTIC